MFRRLKMALRGDSFPERLAAYEEAHAQGLQDLTMFSQNLITQFGAEYTDLDRQQGYLDAVEGRYMPPTI